MISSWATRIVTIKLSKLKILGLRNTKRLVDVRDDLNKFIEQGSIRLLVYHRHEVIRYCLAVMV